MTAVANFQRANRLDSRSRQSLDAHSFHAFIGDMTELEQSIAKALDELDSAVKARAAGAQLQNLLPIFSRLDHLTEQLPKNADPELVHFLRKKSYEKARLLLQGQGARNARGTCR